MIKVSSTGSQRLAETKSGLSYGAITAVEIAANQSDKVIASTQSGEIFTVDILTNIVEEKDEEE